MPFDLTDDQALLRETAVRFVEAELPVERTRVLHGDPIGFDRTWLEKSAELGWYALLVPEEGGGGLVDAAVVADVLGRYVQPGPFLPMNVVASALAAHGSPRLKAEVLPGIVAGEVVAAWAPSGESEARRIEGGVALDGRLSFVQDLASADFVLVPAVLDGEPVQALVPTDADGVRRRPLDSLDLSRRFGRLDLAGVVVPRDAVLDGADAGLHDLALVLLLAETVGAMDALFAMTVAYAQDRVAFGRPIGSFQAIKHILADQALYLETCKAAVVAAANDPSAELVTMAAAYVGDQGNELAQQCLQVHGGIGFTWEHDLHLYMRRIRSNSALFGEPSWHRERLCRLHGLGGDR